MIELRVLGPISLKRADGSNVASLLAQPKRLALAAYLAAPPPHGGRCLHRKDTLVAMFWPELDQHHARAALRNALYFLRTHLGAESVVAGGEDVVGLDPERVWCDLDAFDVAVRIRDHATAYQLYRGALLEGVFVADAQPFEEWLDSQRQRRAVEAREATTRAARRHAALGHLDEALVWARRARELAPLNEDAARLLIALRHVTGDRAGALEEYARLDVLLNAEHGVGPSAETQRLVQAVRDPALDPALVANAIAQVALPAGGVTRRSNDGRSARAARHSREVLDALVETRLGLARRRGERVGLVIVQVHTSAVRDEVLAALSACVGDALRVADLVCAASEHTLAILPSDDGGVDVNALVGRLTRQLGKVRATEDGAPLSAVTQIRTAWLDSHVASSATQMLDEVLDLERLAPLMQRTSPGVTA